MQRQNRMRPRRRPIKVRRRDRSATCCFSKRIRNKNTKRTSKQERPQTNPKYKSSANPNTSQEKKNKKRTQMDGWTNVWMEGIPTLSPPSLYINRYIETHVYSHSNSSTSSMGCSERWATQTWPAPFSRTGSFGAWLFWWFVS